MGLSDDIISILDEFGTKLKDDLQESLRKEVTFGGQDSKLSDKIKYVIETKDNSIKFQLKMPGYGFLLDEGRKPGNVSKEGGESISKWAKRKGIVGKFSNDNLQARLKKQGENKTNRKKKQLKKLPFDKALKALTYLVQRKVQNKGYEGNNFYTRIVEDGRLKGLQDTLAEMVKKDIIIEMKNPLR